MRGTRGTRGFAAACAFAVSLVLTAAPALAQSYPGGGQNPPTVRGEKFFRGNEGFGRTGTDVLLFLLVAIALLCLGAIVRYVARRSAQRDA